MLERRSVASLLASDDTDPALHYRLELSADILDHARRAGLPVGDAYQSYVETGETFVIWNVFAAPPFELSLKQHCFPIAGCVSYRGFFHQADARQYAAHLSEDGYEVFVGGVRAYSTLGWFDDPLLDTYLFLPEEQLAALLFHETAHRLAYAPGDTRFNESLATTVERYLLESWLREHGGQDAGSGYERYLAQEKRHGQVVELIDGVRERLRAVYAADLSIDEMTTQKAELLAQMQSDYASLSASWDEPRPFAGWMKGPINNARLETVADYHQWVAGMSRYLQTHGFERFKTELKRLEQLDSEARLNVLRSWDTAANPA